MSKETLLSTQPKNAHVLSDGLPGCRCDDIRHPCLVVAIQLVES